MRRISFRNRENLEIPTTNEMTKLSGENLRDMAIGLSYALQHGSGATVKLAWPFATCVATLYSKDSKQDLGDLITSLEEDGRSANFGPATVEWD